MLIGRRFVRHMSALGPPPSFDTHKMVQRLAASGFTQEQSVSITEALRDTISESIVHLVQNTSSKSELALLQKEIEHLGNKFTTDMTSHERSVKEEVIKHQSNVKLDWSLEKGRLREEKAFQDSKISETKHHLENEMAKLRIISETVKLDILKVTAGSVVSAAGLILAYLRFVH